MAKTSISQTDLEAKGWRDDGTGVYSFVKAPVESKISEALKAKAHDAKAVMKLIQQQNDRPEGLKAIENVLKACGVEYVTEFVFSESRKWRFDIAIPSLKTAVEYEGVFTKPGGKSRHTNVNGYTEDSNKYNAAQLLGWKVMRYTAKNYKNFLDDLKILLANQ